MDQKLSRKERIEALEKVGWRATLWSGLLGAITGGFIVIVAIIASPLEPETGAHWLEYAKFYGIIFGSGAVLTAIELMLIYVVTIRSARTIVVMCGIQPENAMDDDAERELLLTLIHAGLEAPNSVSSLHGIDPIINVPRWRLIFAAAAYKAKVSATKLLVKALWRRIIVRVLGRSASRAVIEIVAIPVFAGWNAYVTRSVMLELRGRALGSETVEDSIAYLYPEGFMAEEPQVRQACLLAVRTQITGVADFHPNVSSLLERLIEEHDLHPADFDGDGEITDDELNLWKKGSLVDVAGRLQPQQRVLVTRTFAMACALDGRLRLGHRRILRDLIRISENSEMKNCLKKSMRFVRQGET